MECLHESSKYTYPRFASLILLCECKYCTGTEQTKQETGKKSSWHRIGSIVLLISVWCGILCSLCVCDSNAIAVDKYCYCFGRQNIPFSSIRSILMSVAIKQEAFDSSFSIKNYRIRIRLNVQNIIKCFESMSVSHLLYRYGYHLYIDGYDDFFSLFPPLQIKIEYNNPTIRVISNAANETNRKIMKMS